MSFVRSLRALAGAALLATVATAASAETIRFAVTDMAGLEELQREFAPFRDALVETTGYQVEFFPVNSRTAAVEAMGARQVDFVLTGPAEYIVFRERTQAEPVVVWERPNYFAQVVVLASSPFQTAQDLRGKRVAFGDIGSTSAHLAPAQVLADVGLKPGTDYQATNLSRNVAVEAMVRGDLEAVGMNFLHLDRVKSAFPDVQFRVLARGRDLPGDVLIAGPHVDAAIVEKVREAFVVESQKIMDSILTGEDNQKFRGGGFHTNISDSDFNYVRMAYGTIGVTQFATFVDGE